MYKKSQYNYFLKEKDQVICYNGLFDTIFIVKKAEYSIIENLLNDLNAFKTNDLSLFENFLKLGFITNNNEEEIDIYRYLNKKQTLVDGFMWITINPTLNCNANCWYCSTDLNNVELKPSIMSKETIDNINIYVANIISKGQFKIHFDWFGGEPLLGYNKVMIPIIEEIKNNKLFENIVLSQHLTTNGSLLDEKKITYFSKNNLHSYQITIDGSEEKHNNIKAIKNINSFKQTIKAIHNIIRIDKKANVVLRYNYDKDSLRYLKEVVELLPDFDQSRISIDFQRIWQANKSKSNRQQILEAIPIIIEKGYEINLWAFKPLRFYACYADRFNHVAFNYDGKAFKCTARDYSDLINIGSINNDPLNVINNDKLMTRYFSKAGFENEFCLKCKHLPVCTGPCIQKMFEYRKNPKLFPCVLEASDININDFIRFRAKKHRMELLSENIT
ncbi:MAG: SPASM domain-containing protein [Bacteroidia bacterium]|nr:SPASM domain-containing protein [Bacteroidia bacterium]